MKTKTIYLVRHGFRYDQTENNTWNSSERFIENPLDTPLAEEGKKEIQKLLPHIDDKIDFIYSSPMTRCIETALEIQKKLNVPIRIENGLTEPWTHPFRSELKDGKFIRLKKNFLSEDERKYFTSIDKELYLKSLLKKYPGNIDADYKSLFKHTQVPLTEHEWEFGNRIIKVIEHVRPFHENLLFVGHRGLMAMGTPYISGDKTEHDFFGGGPKYTGMMVKFNGELSMFNPKDL